MSHISNFEHECVVCVDQWQNKELGKVQLTDQSIEFASDDRHVIIDITDLEDVKEEMDFVKISDKKQATYVFRFLKRPPQTKGVFITRIHSLDDEQTAARALSLFYNFRGYSVSLKDYEGN